jgi:1-acyl-sn-glycerol-3-phosphate acyltransferase
METGTIPGSLGGTEKEPLERSGEAETAARCNIDPEAVCLLAAQLAGEIDPGRRKDLGLNLDSSLERDLGFDSLAKVELLSRLEKAYGVALREEVLTTAETIRDLVRALASGAVPGIPAAERNPLPPERGTHRAGIADGARTLMEVLQLQVDRVPDQIHLLVYGEEDEPVEVSHCQLLDQAATVAAGLQHLDLQPGDNVALMLPTGLDYFFSFFGVLLAGGVPVPLYPPLRPSQFEDHLHRHRHILSNGQARLLITAPEAKPLARFLKAHVATLRRIVTVTELQNSGVSCATPPIPPEATAFLQYTSGSTGIPKGVILSHTNLLANIRAMGRAIGACPEDCFVSWLPLYHDMGLIGAWLGSLYHGCQLVVMPPLSFLLHPDRWLRAIHRHRGTLAASPNFGYELCLNKIDEAQMEGLDLSSWRLAFNGAEPVSPETVLHFTHRFASCGFRPEAMAPVYGLAESSVGLAFPPAGRGVLIDKVHRQPLMQTGKAEPAGDKEPNPLRFVSCGRVLDGHQLRVVDGNDRELPERQVGHLQFCGPSATSGYFRNPKQTAELFHGLWLDTGDLAYLAGEDLFLTGRVKDIIIRGGRNISPYELEEAIGEIEGIRKGCVAVFGVNEEASGTEKLVVLAESRSQDPELLTALRERVVNLAVDILGLPPDEVILAPPRTVLKTSSGKIRRAASRELYEQGRINRPPRAVWLQLVRLTASGFLQQAGQSLRLAASTGYAGYAWLLFSLIAMLAGPLAFLLPSADGRWRVARTAARLLARLTATPIVVHGLDELTTRQPLILVANHQSYLDSLILMAALPLRFGFVAKAELAAQPLLRRALNRLDVLFVERFETRQAVDDAKRLKALAAGGRSLLFFAEGTFQRTPGLLPFHMGAYLIAAENNMEVVPITIRGTRAKLRSGSWFPRRGPVNLFIGPHLRPRGPDWDSALVLRNEARQQILLHCGEPDLGRDPGER